jgi:protein-S-isoprenylcysteine O-methyltransferase Ste14
MSVFALQMLMVMLTGKHPSDRSHVPAEARKNWLERYTGITANYVWLLAMSYSIFLPLTLGTVQLYIGLLIYAIGLIILTIATFNFITAAPHHAITAGIYRFSRHPMYLAIFLICLGSGIASSSLLFIVLSMILAFCLSREAILEERFCLNKYGKVYQQYLEKVPRWFGLPRTVK